MAANTEGRREIIGLGIGPSEAETFWTEFLRSLRVRGLGGVRLVISDAHTGLKAAIARVFEATLATLSRPLDAQRPGPCLAWSPYCRRRCHPTGLRPQPDRTPCRRYLGARSQSNCARAGQNWPIFMDASEHECWPTCHSRASIVTKLHSTNPIERLNKRKRRADVVGIFPNEASHHAFDRAVLFEQNGRMGRHQAATMMVEGFAQIDKEEIDPILSITTKAA